jgi:hypothetical protein
VIFAMFQTSTVTLAIPASVRHASTDIAQILQQGTVSAQLVDISTLPTPNVMLALMWIFIVLPVII